MKKLVLVAVFALAATGAHANTCKSDAADKKLAGAALNSFMKKCETDNTKSCEADASAKKLSGAARNSFVKKCVSDAVGS
jgi:hypothetical protein